MTATTPTIPGTSTTTQVYRVYIKATAEKIWEAITDPEWTNKYGYTGYTHYDLKPGGYFKVVPNDEFRAAVESAGYPCPDPVVDGEVVEATPPERLVVKWNMLMDPGVAAEGPTLITYEIKAHDGFCALTLIHELEGAPLTAALVSGGDADPGADGGGGHAWVLSDLKSLLETGSVLAG